MMVKGKQSPQQRMRAITHAVTDCLSIAPEHLKECHHLLFTHDILNFSSSLCLDHVILLKHLSCRSMRFGKLGEFVTQQSLQDGVLGAWAPPSGIGRTTISKCLQYLTEHGFIITASVFPIQTNLYFLNFPTLLAQVAVVLNRSDHTYHRDWLKRVVRLHDEYAFLLAPVYEAFTSPVFGSMEECVMQFKQAVDRMGATNKKRKKETPTLDWIAHQDHAVSEDGILDNKIPPRKFLKAWSEALGVHGFPVPGNMTAKQLGMAKNWMKEQTAEGKDPKDYKDFILYIMGNWRRIINERITTNHGKNIPVIEFPSFDFVYSNRAQIIARLYALDNRHTAKPVSSGRRIIISRNRTKRGGQRVKISGGL